MRENHRHNLDEEPCHFRDESEDQPPGSIGLRIDRFNNSHSKVPCFPNNSHPRIDDELDRFCRILVDPYSRSSSAPGFPIVRHNTEPSI
ncbi:MAG: hypothetical protein C0478_00295 [Planctomyces sp.]|nr:hypothetical protein [Planctomyces sp.]